MKKTKFLLLFTGLMLLLCLGSCSAFKSKTETAKTETVTSKETVNQVTALVDTSKAKTSETVFTEFTRPGDTLTSVYDFSTLATTGSVVKYQNGAAIITTYNPQTRKVTTLLVNAPTNYKQSVNRQSEGQSYKFSTTDLTKVKTDSTRVDNSEVLTEGKPAPPFYLRFWFWLILLICAALVWLYFKLRYVPETGFTHYPRE